MTAPRRSCASMSAGTCRSSERIFHPEALASAHHYGFSMRLCQAYRAKTKGKVEHDVSWVRERLLRGAQLHQLRARRTSRGAPGTRRSPVSACTAPTARSSPSAPSATARRCCRCRRPLSGRGAHHPGRRARRVLQLRGSPLPRLPTRSRASGSSSCSAPRSSRSTHAGRPPDRRGTSVAAPSRVLPGPGRELRAAGQGARSAAADRGAPPAAVGLSGGDRWVS